MGEVFEYISRLGASLAQGALGIAASAAAIWVGIKIGQRRGELAGWLSGVALFLILAIALARTFEALDDVRCEGRLDYADCLGEGGGYEP